MKLTNFLTVAALMVLFVTTICGWATAGGWPG